MRGHVWNCNSGCPAIGRSVSIDTRHRSRPGEDLESVLTWLQEVEINAWIQTTPPAHIAAGIHDPYGGDDIRRDFHTVDGKWPRGEIARWLLDTARQYYPRDRQ